MACLSDKQRTYVVLGCPRNKNRMHFMIGPAYETIVHWFVLGPVLYKDVTQVMLYSVPL